MRHSRTYRLRARFAARLWPAVLVAAAGLVAALAPGCGGPQKGEGSGGECFRDADCKEGLVCVEGECSSDVDSLVSVVEGPGTMTAATGAGGVTATAAATVTTTTGAMMGAGGTGAMGAGGTIGASTTNATSTTDSGTTDASATTGSGATGAGGASASTASATATETTGISGNAGAPTDP